MQPSEANTTQTTTHANRAELIEKTHVWVTRGRVDRYMSWLSALFLALGLLAAIVQQQWRFAFGPVPIVALWLLLRFSIPQAGQAQPRLKSLPELRYLVSIFALSLAGVVAMLVAKQLAAGPAAILMIALTCLASVLSVAFQADHARARRISDDSEASIQT